MSRIRGPYVRFCERDEAVTPHPTRFVSTAPYFTDSHLGHINTVLPFQTTLTPLVAIGCHWFSGVFAIVEHVGLMRGWPVMQLDSTLV